jgi:RNA polymerase sigma factor (TIGR02999 family)
LEGRNFIAVLIPISETLDSNEPDSRDAEIVAQLTEALDAAVGDNRQALADLLSATYASVRSIAHSQRVMFGSSDTLSTTALVNEAWIKLQRSSQLTFTNKHQFFALAARAMRQVLIGHAQRRLAIKHGGGVVHETLDAISDVSAETQQCEQLLEMSDALDKLEAKMPRLAEVVYLRYFAGLSNAEICAQLQIDASTVQRDWVKARGWMLRQMRLKPKA